MHIWGIPVVEVRERDFPPDAMISRSILRDGAGVRRIGFRAFEIAGARWHLLGPANEEGYFPARYLPTLAPIRVRLDQ